MLSSEIIKKINVIKNEVDTPFWFYEEEKLLAKIELLKKFDVIRFAQKANSNIHILKIMHENNLSVDAVSLGEIERAHLAGFRNTSESHSIVYTSDMIDSNTIERVIELNIPVNAGSPQILEQIGKRKKKHPVWLRINPGFGHGHSQKTNTGGVNSKHGNWHEYLGECYSLIEKYELELIGLHMHIGSGVDYKHLEKVCDSMVKYAKECPFPIKAISAGGGIPIAYKADENEIDINHYFSIWDKARKKIEKLTNRKIYLEVEPGRFLVGNSGCLVTKVRAIKKMGENNFIITDSGFNDLMRPAMYGSYHKISAITNKQYNQSELIPTIVGGSLCESGDIFTQDSTGIPRKILLSTVEIDDLIVVHDCGAYGASMSSNYNSKPLSPEVLISRVGHRLIRKRQNFTHLLALETDL